MVGGPGPTLRFGERAKRIKNQAKINREWTVTELKAMLAKADRGQGPSIGAPGGGGSASRLCAVLSDWTPPLCWGGGLWARVVKKGPGREILKLKTRGPGGGPPLEVRRSGAGHLPNSPRVPWMDGWMRSARNGIEKMSFISCITFHPPNNGIGGIRPPGVGLRCGPESLCWVVKMV